MCQQLANEGVSHGLFLCCKHACDPLVWVRRSLLWLLDHTRTPFGARLLRSWVAHPLRDAALIGERLDAVQELLAAGAR